MRTTSVGPHATQGSPRPGTSATRAARGHCRSLSLTEAEIMRDFAVRSCLVSEVLVHAQPQPSALEELWARVRRVLRGRPGEDAKPKRRSLDLNIRHTDIGSPCFPDPAHPLSTAAMAAGSMGADRRAAVL